MRRPFSLDGRSSFPGMDKQWARFLIKQRGSPDRPLPPGGSTGEGLANTYYWIDQKKDSRGRSMPRRICPFWDVKRLPAVFFTTLRQGERGVTDAEFRLRAKAKARIFAPAGRR